MFALQQNVDYEMRTTVHIEKYLKKSLIIHKEKTKEINFEWVVFMSDKDMDKLLHPIF